MNLPEPVQAYFDAEQSGDPERLISFFAPQAVVRDEGQTHIGREEIRTWWHQAKAKYRHHADPLEATADGQVITVRAKVTGDFPGSPANLGFAFTLARSEIQSLEIG